MVRAVRQYGRWLRDNYADMEHKEVWQGFMILAVILLIFGIYALGIDELTYQYVVQINDIVLVCYLPWRVETLSDLSIPVNDMAEEMVTRKYEEDNTLSLSFRNNIGSLLKKYCEEPQLYFTTQHFCYATCHEDWHQPSIPQQTLCFAGYQL